MVMALLRTDDAAITLWQLTKAGITVALVETFFGFAPAMATMDLTQVLHGQPATEQLIQGQQLLTDGQLVTDRLTTQQL